MDIKDLAKVNEPANSGVWVTIKHPVTKEPLGEKDKPVRFMVMGATSDAYYKLRDKLITEHLTEEKKDREDMGMRLVAGMVLDVENLEDGGKPLKDAMKIFKMEGMLFIYKQLDEEVANRANFLPQKLSS